MNERFANSSSYSPERVVADDGRSTGARSAQPPVSGLSPARFFCCCARHSLLETLLGVIRWRTTESRKPHVYYFEAQKQQDSWSKDILSRTEIKSNRSIWSKQALLVHYIVCVNEEGE
eukprot:scaffold8374_cov175-Amphora_coffeaeformis.AAC.11